MSILFSDSTKKDVNHKKGGYLFICEPPMQIEFSLALVSTMFSPCCCRSTSGTVYSPTTQTTTVPEYSWTGSSTRPAASAGTSTAPAYSPAPAPASIPATLYLHFHCQVYQKPLPEAGLRSTSGVSSDLWPHQNVSPQPPNPS